MKAKKEYLALAVVIAALVAYLAFHRTDQTHYELPEIQKLTDTKITRLKIEKAKDSIELKREDGQWTIAPEGFQADEDTIEPMVDTVQELDITALVSGGDNYALYELDPENRIHVTAFADGDKVRDFFIGKTAPSYQHTFIQLTDDPRIFHARSNFKSQFDKTTDQLRDKTVLAFEKAQVNRIVARKGEAARGLTLQQLEVEVDVTEPEETEAQTAEEMPQEPVWREASGATVEKSTVDKLLSQVNDLECKNFIEGKTKADYSDPVYTITITDTSDHTLNIYEKAEAEADVYPATSSYSQYPFTLSTRKAERIMKQLFPEAEKDAE